MKIKLLSLALLLALPLHKNLFGMNGGPMNAEWFYSKENPYKDANDYHQDKNWHHAEREYKKLLQDEAGTEYDKNMAQLNLAACRMAQGKSSSEWRSFDAIIEIPKNKRLPDMQEPSFVSNILQCVGLGEKEDLSKHTILVKSNMVGIGDIAHFWPVLPELKERTDARIILSVRPLLIEALQERAKEQDIELLSEKALQPEVDYISHMISLHGHLTLPPQKLSPEKPVFTTTDNAIVKVSNQINPLLAQGTVVVVFEGEDRQATLIGGKQLPRDTKNHGRQLDSTPFMTLLKNHTEISIIDCKTNARQLDVSEEAKDKVQALATEEKPFDTTIALAAVINKLNQRKKIVVMAADNGPANVFARSLTPEAQNQVAFIIPNGGEYDMRMEGNNSKYKQMISNCWVYKCNTPADQSEVVEQAYCDMTKN